jgi:hypothetical protein
MPRTTWRRTITSEHWQDKRRQTKNNGIYFTGNLGRVGEGQTDIVFCRRYSFSSSLMCRKGGTLHRNYKYQEI